VDKIGTPKLSKDHIDPTSSQKIKVKYAVQVFSNCVAADMCTQMSSNFLPNATVRTIDFIDYLDKLFDILNASILNSPKEYAHIFTGGKKQIKFLGQMLYFFKYIKY